MGQKINPVALRLQHTNRFFDSCWYSDFFYADLITRDIQTHNYINSIFKQIQYPSARIFFQDLQKTSKILIFFCSPLKSRIRKSKGFHLRQFKFFLKTPFTAVTLSNKKVSTLNRGFLPESAKTHLRKREIVVKKRLEFFIFPKIKPFFAEQLFSGPSLLLSSTRTPPAFIKGQKGGLGNLTRLQKEFYLVFLFLYYTHVQKYSSVLKKDSFLNQIFWLFLYKQKGLQIAKLFESFFDYTIKKSKAGHAKRLIDFGSWRTFNKKNQQFLQQKLLLQPSISLQLLAFYSPFLPMYNEVSHYTYRDHLESTISSGNLNQFLSNKNVSLYFSKIVDEYKSALFLTEEIVFYLERRVPFRKLKNKILHQAKSKQYLKGLRISCSGRVGGRSKKAQRSRTESIKYGQTSLHVFSSKIDFASKQACTPFGLVGVKVWICFN